jgi:hypothetical protein
VPLALALWCYALAVLLMLNRSSAHAVLAPVCLGTAILLFNLFTLAPAGELEFAFKLDGLGLHAVIVLYLAVIMFFTISPPRDFTASALWAVVLVIEVISLIIDRIGCNFLAPDIPWTELRDTWAQDTAQAVCARTMSVEFQWLPLIVELIVFSLIVGASIRWKQLGRK